MVCRINRGILKCLAIKPEGLIIQYLGMIGFDGDLFVAGKRAENVGSARGCPLQKNKC
nr:MAG TPA_asm: hypothetical protein [Caudoviricetes sp.]